MSDSVLKGYTYVAEQLLLPSVRFVLVVTILVVLAFDGEYLFYPAVE